VSADCIAGTLSGVTVSTLPSPPALPMERRCGRFCLDRAARSSSSARFASSFAARSLSSSPNMDSNDH